MELVSLGSQPARLQSSAIVAGGSGCLVGIFVGSASSVPTIAVYDGKDASGRVLVNTFTPVSATWYFMPFIFTSGLYVAIGGTVDCTVGIAPASS